MATKEDKQGGVTLRLRVQPKASRNAVALSPEGAIRVALTAPPVEGAANKALTEFVAKSLRVPKQAVTLVAGEKSRDKTIRISGLSETEVRSRLAQRGKAATKRLIP